MKTLSEMMLALLERLAEMFPASTYESRFQDYINGHSIDNVAQLESLQQKFDRQHSGGYL